MDNTATIKKADWKKQLRAMKLAHLKKHHRDFYEMSGGEGMKTMPWRDDTSNHLTRSIIDWINFSGIGHANRTGTTGMPRVERLQLAFGKYRDNVRWTTGSSNLGSPDITAVVKARHVSIEVKINKDSMSDNQLKEMQRLTDAGSSYFVARDMEEFIQWYKATF